MLYISRFVYIYCFSNYVYRKLENKMKKFKKKINLSGESEFKQNNFLI